MKRPPSYSDDVTPVLFTLSEACIHVARYSLKLCQDEWTSGSISIVGYAFPAFIFCSALVLMVSSLLPIGSAGDLACAETGLEMLRVLSESSNLAAKDLHEKLWFVRECLEHYRPFMENAQNHHLDPPVILSNYNPPVDTLPINISESPIFPNPDMSAGMAFQSPLMEEFLTQPVSTSGSTDLSEFPLDFDAALLWTDDVFTTV